MIEQINPALGILLAIAAGVILFLSIFLGASYSTVARLEGHIVVMCEVAKVGEYQVNNGHLAFATNAYREVCE